MNKILLIFNLVITSLIYQTNSLIAQSKLSGVLLERMGPKSERIVPYAEVSILGVDMHTTDSRGHFELDLRDSGIKPGDKVQMVVYSKKLGYISQQVTIPANFQVSLIVVNNNLFFVLGTIKDVRTGRPIPFIKVKLVSDKFPTYGYSPPETITDSFGVFSIQLQKDQVGQIESLRVLCEDPKGEYESYDRLHDIRAPIEIKLDDGTDENLLAASQAYNEIEGEMFQNLSYLSSLIMIIQLAPPEYFPEPRGPFTRDEEHQLKAIQFQRNYKDAISQYVQVNRFSNSVRRAFQNDLRKNMKLSNLVESFYNNIEAGWDAMFRYENQLLHLMDLKLQDSARVKKAIWEYQDKLLLAKTSFVMAVRAMLYSSESSIPLLEESLGAVGLPLKISSKEQGNADLLKMTEELSRKRQQHLSMQQVEETAPASDADTKFTDCVELFKLAASAYMESAGEKVKPYFQQTLAECKLNKLLESFVKLSIHRLDNPDMYQHGFGIMVAEINGTGAFKDAGFKEGDVIISINGKVVDGPEMIGRVLAQRTGQKNLFEVIRNQKPLQLIVEGGKSAGGMVTPLIILDFVRI